MRITMQQREHSECIFCNAAEKLGLDIEWHTPSDGSLEAQVRCRNEVQSYNGIVHGGIVSLLLDGVMTNLMFTRGKSAVTGELKVRYFEPVPIGKQLHVSARTVRSRRPFYQLEANLSCGDKVLVRAYGKFMETGRSRE